MRWILVRHGQTALNAEKRLCGRLNPPLSEIGILQARDLIDKLESGLKVVSSDSLRALQTARLAEQNVNLQSEALRERDLGDWEGRSLVELRFSGESEKLIHWHSKPPNGESLFEVANRALRFLTSLPQEDLLIFTHGSVVRTIIGIIDDIPLEEIGTIAVPNAEPFTREVQPDQLLFKLNQSL